MKPGAMAIALGLAVAAGPAAAQDAGTGAVTGAVTGAITEAGAEAGTEARTEAGTDAAPSEIERVLGEFNAGNVGVRPAPGTPAEAPGFFGRGFYIGVERVGTGTAGERFGGHEGATTYTPSESDALLRR